MRPSLRHQAAMLQALYRKSMQALDLLLQTFISENKSMDEVCFLLQVRAGCGAAGSERFPGCTQGGSLAGRLARHPDPSARGAVAACEG